MHFLSLQIAKSTVNISLFAFFISPNYKKHSKHKLICTFVLSNLRKSLPIPANHLFFTGLGQSRVNHGFWSTTGNSYGKSLVNDNCNNAELPSHTSCSGTWKYYEGVNATAGHFLTDPNVSLTCKGNIALWLL